jgi:hypothetical protein
MIKIVEHQIKNKERPKKYRRETIKGFNQMDKNIKIIIPNGQVKQLVL